MNIQIRELLKQATKAVDPDDREWVFSEVDQEKFAKLIVAECAEIALVDGQATGNFEVFNKISRHFGVK